MLIYLWYLCMAVGYFPKRLFPNRIKPQLYHFPKRILSQPTYLRIFMYKQDQRHPTTCIAPVNETRACFNIKVVGDTFACFPVIGP